MANRFQRPIRAYPIEAARRDAISRLFRVEFRIPRRAHRASRLGRDKTMAVYGYARALTPDRDIAIQEAALWRERAPDDICSTAPASNWHDPAIQIRANEPRSPIIGPALSTAEEPPLQTVRRPGRKAFAATVALAACCAALDVPAIRRLRPLSFTPISIRTIWGTRGVPSNDAPVMPRKPP